MVKRVILLIEIFPDIFPVGRQKTDDISMKKGDYIMKSTGIVRKVDNLGRIVLPIELRRTLDIDVRDSLEIFVDGNQVILKKYEPACIFCNSADDVQIFKGKNVCAKCMSEIGK